MNTAKSDALKLLARREYSVYELTAALTKKGHPAADIAEAVAYVQACGYQSDARFTQAFVRDKIRSGNGPLKIGYQIQQKGILDYREHMEESVDWTEQAFTLLARRFPLPLLATHEQREKALRYLYGRGFPPEACRKALKKYIDN